MNISGHLRIEETRLLPGQEWMDGNDAWRFCRVSAGAAYWLQPGQSRALAEGEMLVMPPRVRGIIRASQLYHVTLHAFSFAPEMLCGFFTLTERRFFEAQTKRESMHPHFLSSDHILTRRFAALASSDAGLIGLKERAELLNLAASFFNAQDFIPRWPSSGALTAQIRFGRLVSETPEMEIARQTNSELARACGCSLRHFNRLFREQFGESLRARRTNLRLLRARQLLLETKRHVSEIAREVGYSSPSLFNALFKRRYGISPSGFRKGAERDPSPGHAATRRPGIE
ncbi:MAG TPA: helix-turn-helix transcriptional regulator [Verrucomicrobiae bacterium]|nr:helix-turn-helix transcriptional regulator [Verrucomicrobiae bacterium]